MDHDNTQQGHRMNSIRYLSFVSLLALVALTAIATSSRATAAGQGEGRFHLVYLVAAVDLKPGSRVTVDPVFFTNGKEVKNFHDFCREQNPLKSEQVAADKKFIEDYCARRTFTLDPKDYHALNNHGQRVALEPIEFRVIGEVVIPPDVEHQSDPEIKDPVMMGHTRVHSYTPGTVEPPKWLRHDGAPEYFFFMSRNRHILEQIVPVSKATQAEVDVLTKRAMEFSKVAKWRMAGNPVYLKNIEKARLCYDVTNPILFRMENPLIFDVDVDGKLDMYVNVYTAVELRAEELPNKGQIRQIDCFTSYRIFGNGDSVLSNNEQVTFASLKDTSSYRNFLRNNYPIHTSLVAISLTAQNRVCTYIAGYWYYASYLDYPEGYSLRSENCAKRMLLQKHMHPSVFKGYHTYKDNSMPQIGAVVIKNP